MEVLKNSHINKTSLILNINSKNKSSITNLKSSVKLNEIKNPHLLDNMQNKIKDISSFYQKSHKPNPSIINKPIEINKKELLSNNYLIRTFSYKKAGKNLSKNKNSTKISINKKCKNNLFENQTQKIIEDVNKDLVINNEFFNSNYNSQKEINNIIKEKNLANINNSEDININKNYNTNYDNNINSTCDNNSTTYKNMSYRNDTINHNNTNINNSTNNLHSIISLLNSQNKLYKRNHIQNLKNASNLNKNWYNSNNHINNYESLITLNNSNLSKNYFKNRAKINNLNISNHINSIIIKANTNSNSKKNINNLNNMTIANYTNRNSNHKFLNYNNVNSFNHNIKNNIFKNCKSQIFKNNMTNDKENVNLNKNNYYIKASNSNKYMEKIKTNPSMKIVEDNTIKNIILDNKLNYKFMRRNKTDRGINNQKELTSKEKSNKNIYNHNNFQEIKRIYSKKQVSDFNNSKNKVILEENNNSINNISNKNKINYNNNLNYNKTKNSIKKDIKISLLNNSNIFSPIIKVKNRGNHKHNGSIGTYTSRFNNLNIKNNTLSHIYLNSLDDSEKIISKKCSNIYISNNSFPKKLGNKINYLNINLNNFGNINETNTNTNTKTNSINNTISNNNAISTLPTNINTGSDNCLNFKKKLKNKFLRKQNTSYNNKSLISPNNNIIILNNISMNNLNNISFDYLSKIVKKHHLNNTYKTISSIRKQVNNYVSKEKNIFDNPKEVERHREYYNNQKKLHKKKSNYKNNNRIKEQNLNYVNLKYMNNALKLSKKKESINMAINSNYNNKKVPKNNIIIHNHNNSNSGIFNHSKKNASELNCIQNTSDNLNFGINHKNKMINNNINNINSTNQKTINHLLKSLKGKIIQSTREKILKINSAQISPKKNYNNQLNQLPKDRKNKNLQNINMNKKKSLLNSIKVKEMKNNNSKKEIILRNNDDNGIKVKSVITEYDNKKKIMKKQINLNTLNDINEVSIDATKKLKESKTNEIDKENDISYINKTIDYNSQKENKEIKIIKKKYIRPKSQDINIKNDLIKDKNEERKECIEKENNKEKEPKATLISSTIDLTTSNNNKNDDPQLGKEYLTDIIESLLLEEDYFLNKKNYINPFYLENEKSELNPEMRTVAVDWLVLIHHKIFKFKENTLFLTIQIFDRYLSITNLSNVSFEI